MAVRERLESDVDKIKNSEILKIMVDMEEINAERDEDLNDIEDARVTKIALGRIKIIDKGITALGLVCIALGILEVTESPYHLLSSKLSSDTMTGPPRKTKDCYSRCWI